MRKFKVAVYGINDDIYRAIRNEIDPRKAEIVLFLDNKRSEEGKQYMKLPVFAPTEQIIKSYSIDFILVTPLSAFGVIKKQLIDIGIVKEKIQVFVTDKIYRYCVDLMDNVDKEAVNNLYFEPKKIWEIVESYQEIYKQYMSVPIFTEKPEEWFEKSSLISHACGGVVNGKNVIYSNSREAFSYSMQQGFRLLECDVLGILNGELILAHDYEKFYEAQEKSYSMLKGEEWLQLLKKYPEVNCLVDIKWDTCKKFKECVYKIEKLVKAISEDEISEKTLKKQIVIEVYNEETIKIAKEMDFQMVFTQYRNPYGMCFMNTVNLCYKYGIEAVAIPLGLHWNEEKFIKIFTQKNIKVFVFDTDDISDYQKLKKIGVNGVFTNYLTEEKICENKGIY